MREENFKRVWWTIEKKQFNFQRYIPNTFCLCEIYENVMLMAKGIRKEKKAIQQHHMISSKNSHVTPAMQIILVADKENTLWQKYFQGGMELLLQKAVLKDHQEVMRNLTKWVIHNGLEKMETWKKTKHVTKETFYRQCEQTVVGLKMHNHRKRVQVSRKHYLLQVRGAGGSWWL